MSGEAWIAVTVVAAVCGLVVIGAALWLGNAILEALEEFVREDEQR